MIKTTRTYFCFVFCFIVFKIRIKKTKTKKYKKKETADEKEIVKKYKNFACTCEKLSLSGKTCGWEFNAPQSAD